MALVCSHAGRLTTQPKRASLCRDGTDDVISDTLAALDVYIMVLFNVDGYVYTWTEVTTGHYS